MTPSYDNVFFIGVGRLSGQQGFIVVSHSYKSQTDLGAIKEALVHPDMQMVRGKHYSFTVKTLAWHLTAGGNISFFDLARQVDVSSMMLPFFSSFR